MDFLADLPTLSNWLIDYGSLSLFFLLALGIIALPVPEETLLVIAGILMRQGKLSIGATILAAFAGSVCGISSSYWIGRSFGIFFIQKYGKWMGLSQKRLDKAHVWFERFGKWTLFGGYFVPGVRHFTGLSAGITKLDVKQFALFAYGGAFVWVSLFLSVGYFFGPWGLSVYEKLEFTFDEIFHVILALLLLGGMVIGVRHFLKKAIKKKL